MSRTEGSTRIDTAPYRYAGEGLGFDFVTYEIDGGGTESLGDTLGLDLSDEDPWGTASLTVDVTVSKQTLEETFPSTPPCDGALLVTGYCPTNHYRFVGEIADAPLSAGTHSGVVDFEYQKLRGRVQLTPVLVRTEPLGIQPAGLTGTPFADQPSRKLAHGPVGFVDVDEPVGGRSKDLPTIPTSFEDAPFPADAGNMWYLDLTVEAKPKLYINSDHGHLVPLLQDKGQDGRGRVRQLVVDLYGTQIMTQFVLEAAELYVVHHEIKHQWQERMLTEVCEDLFADLDPDDVATMLEPGQLSETVNQIATTVQRRRAPHESLERVLDLNL